MSTRPTSAMSAAVLITIVGTGTCILVASLFTETPLQAVAAGVLLWGVLLGCCSIGGMLR